MKKNCCVALYILFLLFVIEADAQDKVASDGTIVEQVPCAPNSVTHDQFVERFKARQVQEVELAKAEGVTFQPDSSLVTRLPGKEEYDRRVAYTVFECLRIKYMSDGLKVVGFIWKPKNTTGKKLPLIIYNRGGNRELFKTPPWKLFGFFDFVSSGFVVIASQYRGNDGGEGHEEFGGSDVHDVMNLIPLARSLAYIDMNNVFMFGESRGGMMNYLALKNSIPVNAAATIGGLVDLTSGDRTKMLANYREMIPDFDKHSEESLRERSAVYWPEKINTPVMIIQGTGDWRSNPSLTLGLAQKLQDLNKAYELIFYSGDDHAVTYNRDDAHKRIIEWFRKYMK